jgi:hypothetical protein
VKTIKMKSLPLSFLLLLAACAMPLPEAQLDDRVQTDAASRSFTFCQGYGCRQQTRVSFTATEWARLETALPVPASAAEERRNLAKAIGAMRVLMGEKTGTGANAAGAPPLFGADMSQLDCIDETHNTQGYLRLLHGNGLLRFHTAGSPIARGYTPFLTAGHHSAAVTDTQTGLRYAVDPTEQDMGKDAAITALPDWEGQDLMPMF